MKKNVITLIIFLTLSGICFSQTKVGSTAMLYSSSIRSNGMGQVGIAFVDEYSFYQNPGSLGLYYLLDEISLTPYSKNNNIGGDVKAIYPSMAVPVYNHRYMNNATIGINLAFSYIQFDFSDYRETNYYEVPEEAYDIKDNVYITSLGIGYSGSVQFAIGGSYRYYKKDVLGYKISGDGFDLGFLFRVPIVDKIKLLKKDRYKTSLIPSFGISYSNLDTEIDAIRTYSVYSTRHIGFAIPFKLLKLFNPDNWEMFAFIPAFEFEKTGDIEAKKYGVEIGGMETFYLRIGQSAPNRSNPKVNTWGFTINSGGFLKTITAISASKSNNILNFFANRLTFQYSEAHHNHDSWYNSDPFRGLSIRYKLSRIN